MSPGTPVTTCDGYAAVVLQLDREEDARDRQIMVEYFGSENIVPVASLGWEGGARWYETEDLEVRWPAADSWALGGRWEP